MKLKTFILVSIWLLAAACQKRKYPEETVQLGPEQIFFNGFVDNQPIVLKIGTNGYYCYSSYKQLADSIYLFEGDLKKFDCNPCPVSLQVQLSDYRQRSTGSSVLPDSSFRIGNRSFLPGVARPTTVQFASHSNMEVSSFRWDVSNGISSQDSTMSCEFGEAGPQTVSLTVLTKGNCESLVVNSIFVGSAGDLFACSVEAVAGQNNSSTFSSSIIGGKAPFRYTWNFGDGGSSNQPSPTHTYQWPGGYPVKLQIEDAENHVCESNYIQVVGNDKSSCAANMSLTYAGNRNAFLSGAKIQWTDQSNIIFSSDSVAQPAESYFEVLDSKSYQPNENGESGRLLTLRFNVLLAHGSRRLWLRSENTAMAVTYK